METYRVKGVSVDKYTPAQPEDKPPVVMVHGGQHGSWCWSRWASTFRDAGHEVHALNWFNHGDSDKLPDATFVKRSITDVAREEIPHVTAQFTRPPVLVGHSMGGLASAVYATANPVAGLVLITPVLSAAAEADEVPLPVDPEQAIPAFSYEQARKYFYPTLDEAEAERYAALLVAESAQAVIEATRWTVHLDPQAIEAPVYVLGATLDRLIPVEGLRRYAELLGAEYAEIPDIGHSDVLVKQPEAGQAAEAVRAWLTL